MNKIAMAVAGLMFMFSYSLAFAAANPSGTGQPGAECGDEDALVSPNGFETGGFANAEVHYAGSAGTPSALHAGSAHAVSQYDIACYQLSQ